ncbi:hypothetical protein [Halorussus salinus]|uniref:hypothetical protein n=1 Tax=Halorussus salinus TaxID=1364935 RepID=UPI00138EF8CF|nr:hypothetical protein [Halorussus salinus]
MPMAVAQDSTPERKDEQDDDVKIVADISTLDECRDDVDATSMNVVGTGAHSHSIVD